LAAGSMARLTAAAAPPNAAAASNNDTSNAATRTSTSSSSGKKAQTAQSQSCTLCTQPAALLLSSSLISRPYCLLHYYTSRAVRVGSLRGDKVKIIGNDGSEVFGPGEGDDMTELGRQLPAMQNLFAEAYTQLRERIGERVARSGSRTSGAGRLTAAAASASRDVHASADGGSAGRKSRHHDPLADLLGGPSPIVASSSSGRKRKKKNKRTSAVPLSDRPARLKKPPPATNNDNDEEEGGFVRAVQLPSRYVAQQKKMAAEEDRERRKFLSPGGGSEAGGGKRVGAAAAAAAGVGAEGAARALSRVQPNPYKRRKPNRSSIWNLALEGQQQQQQHSSAGNSGRSNAGGGGATTTQKPTKQRTPWDDIERSMRPTTKCSCGSTDVGTDCNITGRNNDMAKGETWGNKNRSDVVVRYSCGRCGKTWNEEE